MFENLDYSLVRKILTFSSPSTLLTYRSLNRSAYHNATLAIFQGETQAELDLKLALLHGWLVKPTEKLTDFFRQYNEDIISLLLKQYHTTSTCPYAQIILLLSLNALREPDMRLSEENALKISALYLYLPEKSPLKLYQLLTDFNPSLLNPPSHTLKIFFRMILIHKSLVIDEEFLSFFVAFFSRTYDELFPDFKSEFNVLVFHAVKKVLPLLSEEKKQFIKSNSSVGGVDIPILSQMLDCQNAASNHQWLLQNIGRIHEGLAPIMIETFNQSQKKILLDRLVGFNADYWANENQADKSVATFYFLLETVDEKTRVEIFLKIISQDFKSNAGYLDTLPKYFYLFFDKLIRQETSFKDIFSAISNMPADTPEQLHHKSAVMVYFLLYAPEPFLPSMDFDFSSLGISGEDIETILMKRVLEHKKSQNIDFYMKRFRDHPDRDQVLLPDEFLKNIPKLEIAQDREFLIDTFINMTHRSTHDVTHAVIPYQPYFNSRQNFRLLARLNLQGQWRFAETIFRYFKDFSPDFKESIKDVYFSEASSDISLQHDQAISLAMTFLNTPELRTRENFELLKSKLPHHSPGRFLLTIAEAIPVLVVAGAVNEACSSSVLRNPLNS